jgi:TolA-binding protein
VKNSSLILITALFALTATGHTESVYKLKDESGGTVYSDRPELQGTTNVDTVKLAPGPSAEEQQAAKQKVQRMEKSSEEMRQSRINNEQQRKLEQNKETATVEKIESSGVCVDDDYRRRDPKARIPMESPDGEEHPVYEPGKERPVHIAPRPRPRAGR